MKFKLKCDSETNHESGSSSYSLSSARFEGRRLVYASIECRTGQFKLGQLYDVEIRRGKAPPAENQKKRKAKS